ncbi:MAG: hypothetical protein AB1705_08140 [Verrucomicrobiota bacterium]
MNWPSHTDYQDSIQNPHICFEEADLKSGEVGCDMLGLPKVMSGNFASVYSMKTPTGRWAIRCFVRQVLGQQGRYARMSQHLLGLGLDCMVTFEYILRGIKVRNEWYPVVKMQWVDGLPINNFIEENLREKDVLLGLAAKWRVMMKSLRQHQLAHGDLQHGNVMVTPNAELRLVDYDGMYTPAFRGKSPELGHANFQHPRRTPDYYNEDLDNFASLIIYTSLLALATEPELFDKFYTGDNILFLSADYRNPTQSAILKRLKEHKDAKVQKLSALIERCCLNDVSKVPIFEDIMVALDGGKLDDMINQVPEATVSAAGGTAGAAGWWSQAEEQPAQALGSRQSPHMAVPAASAAPAAPKPAAPAPAPAAPKPVHTPSPTTAWAQAPKPAYSAAPKPAAPAAPKYSAPPKSATPAKQAPAPAPAPQPAGNPDMMFWIKIAGIGIGVLILFAVLGRML